MTPIILAVLVVAAVALWISLGPAPSRRRGAVSRRCGRCGRDVPRLIPYIDGRRETYICQMCASEMDFANSTNMDLPR